MVPASDASSAVTLTGAVVIAQPGATASGTAAKVGDICLALVVDKPRGSPLLLLDNGAGQGKLHYLNCETRRFPDLDERIYVRVLEINEGGELKLSTQNIDQTTGLSTVVVDAARPGDQHVTEYGRSEPGRARLREFLDSTEFPDALLSLVVVAAVSEKTRRAKFKCYGLRDGVLLHNIKDVENYLRRLKTTLAPEAQKTGERASATDATDAARPAPPTTAAATNFAVAKLGALGDLIVKPKDSDVEIRVAHTTRAGEILGLQCARVQSCLANPSLAAARGISIEVVTATTDLKGRNIVLDPKGLLVGARVVFKGNEGALVSCAGHGKWICKMDVGDVHKLMASQFSVVGVEPEEDKEPVADEPETAPLGTDEEERVGWGNRDFMLPLAALLVVPPCDLRTEERFDAIVARHHAAIVPPDQTEGTARTRAAAVREAEEKARHAAGRAAVREILGLGR